MTTGPDPSRAMRPQQIKIDLPANLTAQYANFVMITHALSEVFLDFAQLLPNTPQARVHTRLALTPTHAKLLYKALGETLEKYEAAHGEIKTPPTLAEHLFSGVRTTGPAQPPHTVLGDAEARPDDE